jgi:hypothetical protein
MRAKNVGTLAPAAILIVALSSLAGCALPPPDTLQSPTPLPHGGGKYPCPYSASGVLTPWAQRAIESDRGGAKAGAFAAEMAVGAIPVAGDLFAEHVGQEMVKSAAVKAAGGREFMRGTSDQSFDELDDLAVWHYVNFSTAAEFNTLQKFLTELYPYLAENYGNAVRHAKRKGKPGE